MIKDYAHFAFTNFHARKMRTFLTILGIIIGIAAVVSLISLGQGLQNTLAEQFNALGGNKFIVSPAGSLFGTGAPQSKIVLNNADLDIVRRTRGVTLVGGMIFKPAEVKAKDETKTTFVSGIPL